MTSEMENILKGKIQSTVDYNTSKKIIGISTLNLTPNENGIAPLSKQNAFQPIESLDFTEAINNAQTKDIDPVIETLDLPVIDDKEEKNINQPVTEELKEPQTSDVIMENPIQVENPEKLDSFVIPEMKIEIPEEIMESNEPVAIDIQMPTMPETIVANEPEMLNENIFEGVQINEPTKSILETEIDSVEQPLEEMIAPLEDSKQHQEDQQQETFELLEDSVLPKIETPQDQPVIQENESNEENIILPQVENIQQPDLKEEKQQVPQIVDIDKILEEQKNSIIDNFENIKLNLNDLINNIEKSKQEVEKTFTNVISEISKVKELQNDIKSQIMPVTEEIQKLSNQGNTLVDDAIDRINAMANGGLTM